MSENDTNTITQLESVKEALERINAGEYIHPLATGSTALVYIIAGMRQDAQEALAALPGIIERIREMEEQEAMEARAQAHPPIDLRQPADPVELAVAAKAVKQLFDLSLHGPDSGLSPEEVAKAVLSAAGVKWK